MEFIIGVGAGINAGHEELMAALVGAREFP